MLSVFRHAAYDTPWWVNPNRSAGRYHALGDPPAQYWCTHPLGPSAEFLRWQGRPDDEQLSELRLRLWTARVDPEELVKVDFDTASTVGISPAELIDDDYGATQELARRLRSSGAVGLMAPSAALPGTDIVVLFGPRLLFPYLAVPIDEEQVRTGHVLDGVVPTELLPRVRWRGTPHATFEEWRQHGRAGPFIDPPLT